MKKLKISLYISFLTFIAAMFFPSFEGIDTRNFEYKRINYFELIKEKWWAYLLLLFAFVLTMILSKQKSKVLSNVSAIVFVFLNLLLLSLENDHFFMKGYPMLWGYTVVVVFGLLTSILLVLYSYTNYEK